MIMFTDLEPTKENIDYVEAVMNLYMDYEHKFIDENELETKLAELNEKAGGK